MEQLDASSCTLYQGSAGATAPVIYLIDSPEHPFDTTTLSHQRQSTVASVPIPCWNDALTQWPADGIYRGEPPFGGGADQTLATLADTLIPAIESGAGLSPTKRAICGYSLGGLFALFAFAHMRAFDACACLSGSVWYEGWVEHLRELPLDLGGRFAYLSIGTKERKAARPILKTVQNRMEQCATILQDCGCTVDYRTSPGNHMQHIPERLDAGLTALDGFLTTER